MAGVKTLHYTDVKSIATMTPTADGWSVTLSNGHYWRRIHFTRVKAETVSEGECYRHTVEAVLPAKGGVAARDIMALERGRYLVRGTDNNGVRWLMGDNTAPMRLKVTDTNDGTADGETAYTLTFSGLSQWPQMKTE